MRIKSSAVGKLTPLHSRHRVWPRTSLNQVNLSCLKPYPSDPPALVRLRSSVLSVHFLSSPLLSDFGASEPVAKLPWARRCRPERPQGWTLGPRHPRHSGEPCGFVPLWSLRGRQGVTDLGVSDGALLPIFWGTSSVPRVMLSSLDDGHSSGTHASSCSLQYLCAPSAMHVPTAHSRTPC